MIMKSIRISNSSIKWKYTHTNVSGVEIGRPKMQESFTQPNIEAKGERKPERKREQFIYIIWALCQKKNEKEKRLTAN